MRIKYMCPYCLPESNQFYLNFEDIGSVELIDKYCYECICPNGHKNNFFIQNPRYELLFDFGVSAYLDGYYREAVLDFAAALERFYEYAIYVMLGTKNRNEGMEEFWKQIKKQSERQLGAYVALYFNKFGTAPNLPSNSQVSFRNNVTHNGYFPSKEETEKYAQFVGDYIVTLSKTLPDDMDAHLASLFPVINEIKKGSVNYGGHNIITVISMLRAGETFECALSDFKKNFAMFYSK